MPLDLPLYYPNGLKLRTTAIIGEALKNFPVQTQTLELCKYVISKLTPHFCAVVRDKELRADLAPDRMSDLVHCLLVANCHDPSERFRFEKELIRSDEWVKLIAELLAVAELDVEKGQLFDLRAWRTHYQENPDASFEEQLTVWRDALSDRLPLPLDQITRSLAYYENRRAALSRAYPYLLNISSGLEPDSPEEQEFRLCEMVLPLLRLEIAERSRPAAQSAAPARTGEPTATSPNSDPEVAKRRAIIRQNPGVPAQGLCTMFDNTHVPLPKDWGVPTWTQAYKDKTYRSRIHVIISKGKKGAA
jgi:hypothetical protein